MLTIVLLKVDLIWAMPFPQHACLFFLTLCLLLAKTYLPSPDVILFRLTPTVFLGPFLVRALVLVLPSDRHAPPVSEASVRTKIDQPFYVSALQP